MSHADNHDLLNRLKRAQGHLATIVKMVEDHRDGLDIPVEWTGGVEQRDGPVTLRIKLQNARLFALWCSR